MLPELVQGVFSGQDCTFVALGGKSRGKFISIHLISAIFDPRSGLYSAGLERRVNAAFIRRYVIVFVDVEVAMIGLHRGALEARLL